MRGWSARIMLVGCVAFGSSARADDRGILVAGNQRVEADTIRSYFHAGPKGGFDAADLDAGLKELYATGLFSDVQHTTFSYDQELDRDGLANRVRSISYVAAMDESQREALVQQVLRLVADQPEQFSLPYTTLVFWCSKRS